MLYHHDSRDYEAAAADASAKATAKMERIINSGRPQAADVLRSINETVPYDRLTPARTLSFRAVGEGVEVAFRDGQSEGFHTHALGQLATRAGLTKGLADKMAGWHVEDGEQIRDQWGARLLAHNLNEIYNRDQAQYLTRSVGGQVRGFLSDRFKRIDVRPSVEAFITAVKDVGGEFVAGYDGQVKTGVKALIPQVFYPTPHEPMLFGVSLLNSDFGAGALSIKPFIMRLWCTNYAIMEESLRAVHLGSKMMDDADLWSLETLNQTSKALSMQVNDSIKGVLAAPRIEEYIQVVREADSHTIDFKTELAKLKKKGLSKGEGLAVQEVFNTGGIEQLPMGNTQWRLSNAISWVAGKTESPLRKLDLMEMAGGILPARTTPTEN